MDEELQKALEEYKQDTPFYITPSQIDAFTKGFIKGRLLRPTIKEFS